MRLLVALPAQTGSLSSFPAMTDPVHRHRRPSESSPTYGRSQRRARRTDEHRATPVECSTSAASADRRLTVRRLRCLKRRLLAMPSEHRTSVLIDQLEVEPTPRWRRRVGAGPHAPTPTLTPLGAVGANVG